MTCPPDDLKVLTEIFGAEHMPSPGGCYCDGCLDGPACEKFSGTSAFFQCQTCGHEQGCHFKSIEGSNG